MPKVLFAQNTDDSIVALLKPYADVQFAKEGDCEDLMSKLADADAVITGTWVKWDRALIDAALKLKVISRTGVGVDTVDVGYATEKGILVLNTPSANTLSVAEHTVAMIAAVAKQFSFLDRSVRDGNFKARRLYVPFDLYGKTLGIIGCGGIGRLTAQKCRAAFDMKVAGYDPFVTQAPESMELFESMEEVFSRSDIVSLHIPMTEKTKNCVDKKMLSLMKPGACLVNTSRGGIVDEAALMEALQEKRLAAAALDVFEQEPPPEDWPLLALDNLLLTPHTAALTKECTLRVAACAAKGVADFLQGKAPEFVFNREVLNRK